MSRFDQPAPVPEPWSIDARLLAAQAAARDAETARVAAAAQPEKVKIKARRQAEAEADAETESLRKVVGVRASSVVMQMPRWLWRDRVPLGGLSLLAGRGDVSKSTLFAEMVGWLTTGTMKGHFYGAPHNVGYVSSEDSREQTIVPRMVAAGADLDRVYFLEVETPLGKDALSLPRDAELLKAFIRANALVCTFIDPLSANVTGKANDQREIRSTYQIVNSIAEQTNSSVFGLAHTRKAGAQDVVEAVMGSSEQTNVARSVHGLVQDPEEDGARLLSTEKLNVGQKHLLATLRFRVNSEPVWIDGTGEFASMPKIEWLGEVTDSASDILADQVNGHGNLDACVTWLEEFMRKEGGEAFAKDVKEAAKFSESMLHRARRRLGIVSTREKTSRARSVWSIPPEATV